MKDLKFAKLFTIILFVLLLIFNDTSAQPIPVELMLGNNFGSVNITINKRFSPESRFGIFLLNSVEFDYNEDYKNSLILRNMFSVETVKNLEIVGGLIYTNGGLDPQTGLLYTLSKKKVFFLFNPNINIESDPAYDIMTIFEFKPKINDRFNLYTHFKFLNVFTADSNFKSYQWMRLGLESRGLSFGLAFNLDEHGPNPSVETNFGLFVQKTIF
ncbi:hypothetical protein OU798_21975 [Prolixibacteraceae bacterium Z1-6]|uniref:Uncharacterized protein n=1 Tax=Draconibacterium aestuarii TaxID=2998507 RepID=A0A9X3FB04_9BACT|nr:hypothetical protein [Prolixibacteraceae bacterium Z1-6]